MKRCQMRWLALGVLAAIVLCACSTQQTPFPTVHPGMASRKVDIPPAQVILANGNFDLMLIADAREHDVRIIADTSQVHDFVARVTPEDSVLHLTLSPMSSAPAHRPTVVVRLPNVTGVEYTGTGNIDITGLRQAATRLKLDMQGNFTVRGKSHLASLEAKGKGHGTIENLTSPNFKLTLKDKMRVDIRGVVNVTSLNVSDNASINLYWLDSPTMEVTARHHSHVQLAGIAGKLTADVFNSAVLDARYLRVQDAFVKTYGQSRADLYVIGQQHTLASDRSNIYYFNEPDLGNDYMSESGAVLDRQGIN